ncbi:hypothetical protein GF373_07290 [bacterium]|nr:hypothetical protein [bacterium]
MPFAKEQDVRQEGFLEDFNQVPSASLRRSLQKAHEEVLRETVLTDESEASTQVIRAESLLAIAFFLQSTQIASSLSLQKWKTSTLQIDEQTRVNTLEKMAADLRDEAYSLMQPYLKIVVTPSILVTRRDGS